MNYLLHIMVMINIYMILALSLNLLMGFTGILSLCHAAFYGIGAYTWTLLVMNVLPPGPFLFPLALGGAILVTVLLSFLISLPALRLRHDFLVLATLGFQVITFTLLYNWTSLTNGPFGIPGIPRPEIFGITIRTLPQWAIFTLIIAAICIGLLHLLMASPFGRALKAIRDDELAAASLGKNIAGLKITAFAIAAGFAAVPGALFAGYMRYIDPTSFTITESIFILSLIIIGGTGNLAGPILGAVLLVTLPELLRFLGMPDAIAANTRQILYGLAMIVVLRYLPSGLAGDYDLK